MSVVASMGPSAFSKDGKYYAQIGDDGKCKIWETGTSSLKQEFTPDLHLSAPLTCLYWIQLDGGTSTPKWKNRKRKSSRPEEEDQNDNSNTTDCIAFGTRSGKILIYSLAHARVESILEDVSGSNEGDQEIRCMDWSQKNGLYTCSVDSTIREWRIEEGKVKSKFKLSKHDKDTQNSTTTAMKVFCHQTVGGQSQKLLITASCQIRVWSLESHRVVRRMVGHAGDVVHLHTVPIQNEDRFYILSGSKSDRILCFWSVHLSSEDLALLSSKPNDSLHEYKKTKRRSRTKSSGDDQNEEISEACCNFLMEDSAKQVCCVVQDPNISSSLISVVAVTRRCVLHYYQHTLNGHSIKPVKPSTTIQVVSEEDGSVKLSPAVCGSIVQDHLLVGYTTSRGIVFERIVPDISEKTQVLIRTVNTKDMTKKDKAERKNEDITRIRRGDQEGAVYLSTHVGEGQAQVKGGKKVDVPMELRLANLSIEQGNKQPVESSSNMAQLLVQALHSKDTKLLQTVFECTDPVVACNTLNRLPIQYLPTLLEHLTNMMAKRTNRCKSACVWTVALCKARGSVLLGQEQGVRPLVAALKARAPHLSHLLALKGRLSLLSDKQNREEEQKPVLEYKDSSSEDEEDNEMDGFMNAGGDDSAVSWNEEEDDESDGDNMSE